MSMWRRGWDSNPRGPLKPYRFSRSAPSTTRTPLPVANHYTNRRAGRRKGEHRQRCRLSRAERKGWSGGGKGASRRLGVVFGVEVAAAAGVAELALQAVALVVRGVAAGGHGLAGGAGRPRRRGGAFTHGPHRSAAGSGGDGADQEAEEQAASEGHQLLRSPKTLRARLAPATKLRTRMMGATTVSETYSLVTRKLRAVPPAFSRSGPRPSLRVWRPAPRSR